MRTVPGPLATAIAQSSTSLARLVDVVTNSGQAFYYTDCDSDVLYNSHVYSSTQGCDASQVRSVLGTSAESCSIDVFFDPAGITTQLVETGALDDARLRVLVIDATAPGNGAIVFFEGFVQQCTYSDNITLSLVAQPLVSRDKTLAQDVYTSNCRADFGDSKCKYPIDNLKHTATLTVASSLQVLTTTDTHPDHAWQAGLVVFTSGVNEGFSVEIADSLTTGVITLRGLLPFQAAMGDAILIYPGCDKTPSTCAGKYDNIVNFRGEPFQIAPWIVTADQPVSAAKGIVSDAYDRTLCLIKGYMLFDNLGPGSSMGLPALMAYDSGCYVWMDFAIADQWGFPISNPTESACFAANPSYYTLAASQPTIICTAFTMLSSQNRFVNHDAIDNNKMCPDGTFGGLGGRGVIVQNARFSLAYTAIRKLTDDETATVKMKYPQLKQPSFVTDNASYTPLFNKFNYERFQRFPLQVAGPQGQIATIGIDGDVYADIYDSNHNGG